jgi:hypothetical protein
MPKKGAIDSDLPDDCTGTTEAITRQTENTTLATCVTTMRNAITA